MKFKDYVNYYYSTLQYIAKWGLISAAIAVLAGSASAIFLTSLSWATEFRESNDWMLYLLPLGGFIAGLLYHFFGKEVESGNNQIIDQVHKPETIIKARMAPLVFIGTVITHLFGGSAGREGTAIQMSASLSDQLTKVFSLSKRDRRIILISAIAAGFGSVFGTPLAGAIFGLEVVVIGRMRYDAILPAFLSSIMANWVTFMWGANHAHYHLDIETAEIIKEVGNSYLVMYAAIAGVFFGLASLVFTKSIKVIGDFFKKLISFKPLIPLVGGIIIIAMVLVLDYFGINDDVGERSKYIGLGLPTISAAFETQLPFYDWIFKLIFTSVTLGTLYKGGEVTPLFFIGATLGNALVIILPLPVSFLAAIGFVAVFAGAANTPIATTIMAIELFGADIGIYAGVASVVAYIFSGHTSIYSSQKIGSPKRDKLVRDVGKSLKDV